MSVDQDGLCNCLLAPIPHRHPAPETLAPVGSRPAPESPRIGLDAVAEMADPSHPWMASALAGTRLAEALLPSVSQQVPARPAAPRPGPLYGIQFLRKEALRLAIEFYRDAVDDEDAEPLTDIDAVATADRFAEFIRNGTVPGREKEA